MNHCDKCQNRQINRCFLSGWVIDKEWKEKCNARKYYKVKRDGRGSSEMNNPVMRLMHNIIKY